MRREDIDHTQELPDVVDDEASAASFVELGEVGCGEFLPPEHAESPDNCV